MMLYQNLMVRNLMLRNLMVRNLMVRNLMVRNLMVRKGACPRLEYLSKGGVNHACQPLTHSI
jgi:hypothetical protein